MEYSNSTITGRTDVYGLIGDPVDHSMSPLIQNTAFRSIGIDAVYVPFRVKQSALRPAVAGLRAEGVKGFNVTLPHKVRIMKHLDKLDHAAAEIGSVNTVVNRDSDLFGYNTDGIGAVDALKHAGVILDGKSVLLFGAGGAGTAIAFATASHAKTLILVNRTISKARRLQDQLRKKELGVDVSSTSISNPSLPHLVGESDVIINASSMGMDGKNDLPVNADSISSRQWILDIVYRPIETKFFKMAESAGAKAVNGLDMLVSQGAASFELWTGKKAPISEMRHAIARKLLAMADAQRR